MEAENNAFNANAPGLAVRDVEVEPRDAERVLPEEMWGKIFGNISDNDDLWRVGLVCGFFQKIALKPSKNDWLFRELFPLLAGSYLDESSILKCRQLNKSCKEVVGGFLQKLPSRSALYRENRELEHWYQSYPSGIKELTKFKFFDATIWGKQPEFLLEPSNHSIEVVNEMKSHPGNPILLRCLRLNYFNMTPQMWEGLSGANQRQLLPMENFSSFIQNLGKHFWHVEVDSREEEEMLERDAAHFNRFTIHDLLAHTPNIRSLCLDICDRYEGQEEDPHEKLPDVSSLPDLADLESLSLRWNSDPADDVCPTLEKQLLTKYHGQLKTLLICDPRILNWPHFRNFCWDNLLELSFSFEGTHDLEDGTNPLLNLKAPRLQKLIVADLGPFPYMLSVLNQLPRRMPHLHILRLYLIQAYREDLRQAADDEIVDVYADQAFTVLEIDATDYTTEKATFAFLLRFPFVEKLHITYNDDLMGDEEEQVEVITFMKEKRMHESNIWRMLPRLKTLFVRGTDDTQEYTREGYEIFMETIRN